MRSAVLVVCGLLTISALGQSTNTVSAARTACGSDAATFRVTTNLDAGKATPVRGEAHLYFIEEQERVAFCPGGCGITVKVGLDGDWAGATSGSSYLEVPITAGDHNLCAAWQSKLKGRRRVELTSFRANSGQDTYFRIHIVPPTPETFATFTLEPITPEEGRLLISSSPKSTWTKNN